MLISNFSFIFDPDKSGENTLINVMATNPNRRAEATGLNNQPGFVNHISPIPTKLEHFFPLRFPTGQLFDVHTFRSLGFTVRVAPQGTRNEEQPPLATPFHQSTGKQKYFLF